MSVTIAAESNTLLTYGISTEPSPLQTSISNTQHTYGEIQIAVSNNSDVAIWCRSITLTVETGSIAQSLFEPGNADHITCSASPSPDWDLKQPAAGTFVAQPSKPKFEKITTDGIFLDISQIIVNTQVGNCQLTITEVSSLDGVNFNTSSTSFQISKFPAGFFVRNFTTSSPQVPNGTKAILKWEGSQNAKYVILYNSEQPVDVTKTRALQTPALTSDTTFILKASVSESGQTVETYLNLTVLVLHPNLAATSLQVLEATKLGTSLTTGTPLSFTDNVGEKVSLWGQAVNRFGLGVQPAVLQIYTDNDRCDIAFGYGTSAKLNETLRIKGSGKVGIGVNPDFPLSFPSVLGDKINLWGGAGAHYGFGVQNDLLQIHTDGTQADIAFGSGSSTNFAENMRVKGSNSILLGASAQSQNGIMLTTSYANWAPDRSTLHAEICNDVRNPSYKALMLVGNASRGPGWSDRWVQVWDSLDVKNDLYVAGNFHKNFGGTWWAIGNYYAVNKYAYWISDVRLKNEVETITSAVSKVRQLRGVTFHWNEDALKYLTRDIDTAVSAGPLATPEEHAKARENARAEQYKELGQLQVGVLAQEVEAVLAEAVITNDTGIKAVNYDKLIPLLIEAIKEQQSEIDALKQAIAKGDSK